MGLSLEEFCSDQLEEGRGLGSKNTKENGEKERDPAAEETVQEVQSDLHSFI